MIIINNFNYKHYAHIQVIYNGANVHQNIVTHTLSDYNLGLPLLFLFFFLIKIRQI